MRLQNLNNDQLDGLANLCFDLAKGAIGLAILPSFITYEGVIVILIKVFFGLFWGLVFTYLAMLLLKVKEGKLE